MNVPVLSRKLGSRRRWKPSSIGALSPSLSGEFERCMLVLYQYHVFGAVGCSIFVESLKAKGAGDTRIRVRFPIFPTRHLRFPPVFFGGW